MAGSTKKMTLEEVRKARNEYRLARSQRLGAIKADLAPPTVIGIIDPVDGTLSADAVRADLEVQVPEWDNLVSIPGFSDTLYLEWAAGDNPSDDDFEVVDTLVLTAPVEVGDTFPALVKVPLAKMSPDGPYTLRYRVVLWNSESDTCPPIPIICDSMPPWKYYEPAAMILPVSQLTDAELSNFPQGMPGTLPDYQHADWQLGDKVAFYWLTTPLPDDPADLPAPVGFVPVSASTASQVTFPLDILKASLDQDYYTAYFLFDKAGNRSPLSAYTRVDVALGDWFSGLLDPVVPLAELDGEINVPDARLGVDVEIPRFTNFKPRDRIEVTWGTQVLDTQEIGAAPTFPFPIRVPSPTLLGQYNLQTGGAQPTNVSYRVLRGNVPSEVKAITINVDLSYIGPDPDPGWPNPINPALPLPEVYGKTSIVLLNQLTRADANQDADLKVDLYGPLNEGEIIDFYWGSQLVTEAQYIVPAGVNPGEQIIRQIPWARIQAEGNNSALPVYYSIHAAGSENDQQCVPIAVSVDVLTLTPEAPVFEGLNPNGMLSCVSLYEDPDNPSLLEPAVRVRVPDLSQYLNLGDTLTLSWVVSTEASGPWNPIVGAEKVVPIVLDATHPPTGFLWYVEPYVDHILPTYTDPTNPAGRARIHYEFALAGETIVSDTTEVVVAMFNPAGTCPIPPNP